MGLNIGYKYVKEYVIQPEDGEEFARVSGDRNPIHIDEAVAAESRFGKRIAHGMLVGSYFSAVIGNDFPGNGSIYMSQNLSFRAPVYYGERIRIEVEVTDIIKEKKRILLSTKCFDSEDKILVDGDAMVYKEDI